MEYGHTANLYSQDNNTQQIVNSIENYIEVFSPSLSYKYVKTPDGRDLKYTDYLKENIKSSKGSDLYLFTALSSFSSIIASISSNDAKEYGIRNNNSDSIRLEYQKFHYLTIDSHANDSKKIEVYINAIKAISFHLKVKDIPAYKNIDVLVNNLETITKKPHSFNTKLWYCHSAFSYALEAYAKTIVYGFLPENEILNYEYRLKDLSNQKQKLVNQINNTDIPIRTLSDGEMKLIVSYFDLINEAISSLMALTTK